MFNKYELMGAGASVFFMALALYITQVESTFFSMSNQAQTAQVSGSNLPGVVIVSDSGNITDDRTNAFLAAADDEGNLKSMVIDDVKVGTGDAVKKGDLVSVHYVGTLQSGQEFDNSKKRGQPFEFKVGAGQVIQGWDEGLVGMQVGGQRMLVIPPEKAYGEQGIGPIPPNATLVFAIELMEIK